MDAEKSEIHVFFEEDNVKVKVIHLFAFSTQFDKVCYECQEIKKHSLS